MNTIIIEHADQSTTALFKQLAEKLGLAFKTQKEKTEEGIITNPELHRRIEKVESGNAELIEIDLKELEKLAHA